MVWLRAEWSARLLEAAVVDRIGIFGLVFADGRIGLSLDRVDNWVACFVEWFATFVEITIRDFYCSGPVSIFHFVVDRASDLGGQFPKDHLFQNIINCQ